MPNASAWATCCKGSPRSRALFEVVADSRRADWLIRLAAPQAGQVYLVPGSGWPLDQKAGGLPPLFGPLAAEAQVLKDRLTRIARFKHLLRIAGDTRAEPLLGGSDVDVGSEFRVLAFLGGDEVGIISSYLTSF